MATKDLKTIEALQAFLDGNQLTAFTVLDGKTQRGDSIPDKNDRVFAPTANSTY